MEGTEEAHCPECHSRKFVKNGKVRRTQRYRCGSCDLNFVHDPKHRWPPSSKLINLIVFQDGEVPKDPVKAARCGRWVLEAKEHHPWFVRALAEQAVYAANREGETIETTLAGVWGLYAFITKRNPEHFYEALAPELYLDMFKIGGAGFKENLMAWLEAHSLRADGVAGGPTPGE
ncbi:UNVERIFIED_ORG: hypothetical protein M2312_001843 [Rhizobium esperanzae]|uniref:IS1 family transposase n=1 Tax=Rhizobium phaseoli TaxID=396 RepID=A0A7X6F111_9HYPH|nr:MULTISPECIES: hypothetical protein [Rhizobium]MDH6647208.1 hypothetical protein [Rhizobium esperanzae]MDE8759788.1 hypothetical protein [Rhizobium sp. CBK13]MDK4726088.1 hypothetical protein [Rhizobium phaseoli]NKE86695.1 IS1 family transposase [Rhizobium phaseoli]NKF11605.1 IS1 family transposase [Rhizobium phaseoli]